MPGVLGAVGPDCKMCSGKLVPVLGLQFCLQPLSHLGWDPGSSLVEQV